MKPDRLLAGQVAVISGGAGDIGRAIARRLHAHGARVALGDVLPIAKVRARVAKFHYTEVDVSDSSANDAWLTRVTRDLGLPTLIIPNAAVVELGSALDTSVEAWNRTLNVNLTGAFLLAQLAARRLLAARRRGRIVFVGSWAAHAPHPNIAAYCAAKAGLRMAMQCLALELAPHGILVNEVAPGRVDAGLSKRLFDQTPGFRERARAEVPIRSLLDPSEVADGVAYLCRPDNRQMTGSVLLLDGGLSLVRAV
jgi:Dehydrogenases with different specificities (related to short-chain alcohol dehydrogenases)